MQIRVSEIRFYVGTLGSMAIKTIRTLTDDLDGSAADVTIAYTWSGQAYEIDLSDTKAREFQDAVAPYLVVSRTVGRTPRRARTSRSRSAAAPTPTATPPTQRPPSAGGLDQKAVRAWARANGVEVSSRGRLTSAVVAQYQASQR